MDELQLSLGPVSARYSPPLLELQNHKEFDKELVEVVENI
jgi:hypothetical protein